MRGRVQGVGYRWFVKEQADALGLTGWVRNLPNGTVALEAQGEKGALADLARALKTRHPYAGVDGLEQKEIPPAKKPETGFSIRG